MLSFFAFVSRFFTFFCVSIGFYLCSFIFVHVSKKFMGAIISESVCFVLKRVTKLNDFYFTTFQNSRWPKYLKVINIRNYNITGILQIVSTNDLTMDLFKSVWFVIQYDLTYLILLSSLINVPNSFFFLFQHNIHISEKRFKIPKNISVKRFQIQNYISEKRFKILKNI